VEERDDRRQCVCRIIYRGGAGCLIAFRGKRRKLSWQVERVMALAGTGVGGGWVGEIHIGTLSRLQEGNTSQAFALAPVEAGVGFKGEARGEGGYLRPTAFLVVVVVAKTENGRGSRMNAPTTSAAPQ